MTAHERVAREDMLLRRFFDHEYIAAEGRVQSGVFAKRKTEDGLSDFLERLSNEDAALALGRPGQGVCRFPAGLLLDAGYEVVLDPIEGAPGHCIIPGKITGSMRTRLSHEAEIIHPAQPTEPKPGSG